MFDQVMVQDNFHYYGRKVIWSMPYGSNCLETIVTVFSHYGVFFFFFLSLIYYLYCRESSKLRALVSSCRLGEMPDAATKLVKPSNPFLSSLICLES